MFSQRFFDEGFSTRTFALFVASAAASNAGGQETSGVERVFTFEAFEV